MRPIEIKGEIVEVQTDRFFRLIIKIEGRRDNFLTVAPHKDDDNTRFKVGQIISGEFFLGSISQKSAAFNNLGAAGKIEIESPQEQPQTTAGNDKNFGNRNPPNDGSIPF